jgi:hypothetical protein
MMDYVAAKVFDTGSMPRGGPDASSLDRWLQTDHLESLDRDDVDDVKRTVVRSPDHLGRLFGRHDTFGRIALDEVADVPDPKILGLGPATADCRQRYSRRIPPLWVLRPPGRPQIVVARRLREPR